MENLLKVFNVKIYIVIDNVFSNQRIGGRI